MTVKRLTPAVLIVCLASFARANDVPLGGFIPFVGIGLTDEFETFDTDPTGAFSIADVSNQVGGNPLGPGVSAYYDIALLDTGATTHILTQAAASSAGFDISGEGFQGTENQPIFGATGGTLNLTINDAMGIYAAGLADRTGSDPNQLEMDTNALRGQTSVAILEGGSDWTLPNIVGLPLAAQHGIAIRNDDPQIFEFNDRTMRTPQVEFLPLGTGDQQGIQRRTDLKLRPSASFLAGPTYLPNLFNIFNGHDNPASPTVVENGGLYLEIDAMHEGNAVNDIEFLFDTGADLTVVSELTAVEMGFDAVLDEPDFLLEVEGAGGVLGDGAALPGDAGAGGSA